MKFYYMSSDTEIDEAYRHHIRECRRQGVPITDENRRLTSEQAKKVITHYDRSNPGDSERTRLAYKHEDEQTPAALRQFLYAERAKLKSCDDIKKFDNEWQWAYEWELGA